MHALSDIEFHNFVKRIIEVYVLIINCVSTFSKCVFSKYYAKKISDSIHVAVALRTIHGVSVTASDAHNNSQ